MPLGMTLADPPAATSSARPRRPPRLPGCQVPALAARPASPVAKCPPSPPAPPPLLPSAWILHSRVGVSREGCVQLIPGRVKSARRLWTRSAARRVCAASCGPCPSIHSSRSPGVRRVMRAYPSGHSQAGSIVGWSPASTLLPLHQARTAPGRDPRSPTSKRARPSSSPGRTPSSRTTPRHGCTAPSFRTFRCCTPAWHRVAGDRGIAKSWFTSHGAARPHFAACASPRPRRCSWTLQRTCRSSISWFSATRL